MNSIQQLIKSFELLSHKYGYIESYRALKTHYNDICSNGDLIINNLIDGLHSNNNNYYINLLDKYKNDLNFVDTLINDYLLITINNFLNHGLKPDPFHVEKIVNEHLVNEHLDKNA
jgi:hypothetical protein